MSGATSIEIMPPDTDVFVLSLRGFPQLCQNTTFVIGREEHLRKIALRPILDALGPARIAALPGFHAWSGADVMCKEIVSTSFELRFSLTRKGKVAMLEGIPRC